MSAATCLSADAARWLPPQAARLPAPEGCSPAPRLPLSYAATTLLAVPRVVTWPGLSVMEWTVNGDRIESLTTPASHLALMVRAGRRLEGESRLAGGMRSSLRDMAGTVTVIP